MDQDVDQDAGQDARTGSWPPGPGGMAERVRRHPWAATPLGPIEAWSERMRLAAELVLASPLVSSLVCGPERVLLYNDAAALLYGDRHPGALGRPLPEVFPEGWAVGAPLYARVFAGETVEVAAQPLDLHGEPGRAPDLFDATLIPVRDAAGRVVAAHMVGVEVGSRLRAEERLRASEERFRSFAENSADTLWIIDAETRRLEYLSPAFETMWGEGREAIMRDLGRWAEMVHPEDRERASQALPRLLVDGAYAQEYRIVRAGDGAVRWIQDTGFPVRDRSGHLRRVAGIAQDVTDRKRAEDAVRESRRRLRSLVEGMPQLVWRAAEGGHWTWSSPQWSAYTGLSEAESRGHGWLAAVHPDDRGRALAQWREAPHDGVLQVEYRLRHVPEDVHRWYSTRAAPVRDEDGRIIEWLGTSTDIDDLRRLQEEQRVLVAELQHRTRNLLAVVGNVARRSLPPSPARDEFESRLAALGRVQGFLSCSPAHRVSLRDLVEAELQAVGEDGTGRASVVGPPVLLPGEGVQSIALALHELATNAVKYGAVAEPAGRLRVTWRLEGADGARRLVLDWRESGVPMPDGPPGRRGYGRELIERALPYQLKAETRLVFTADGVHCSIRLPPGTFQAGERP